MKNYSKQREEIIEVVKNCYNHPTAEDIYMIVKGNDPAVSRSTVYRNLGMLSEHGIIQKISMLVGPDRYDYKRMPHNHAICTKCGKVFDFDYDFKLEKLKKSIKEQTGIEVSSEYIAIEGICEECKIS